MKMSEAELERIIKNGHCKIIEDNHGFSASNLEQNSGNGTSRQNEIEAFDSPVIINIHSKRHRLCDSDGISGKWVIDAIVKAGILVDDSPKEVKSVTFSQEKITKEQIEQTIITIKDACLSG